MVQLAEQVSSRYKTALMFGLMYVCMFRYVYIHSSILLLMSVVSKYVLSIPDGLGIIPSARYFVS